MQPTIYVPSRLLKLLATPASSAGEVLSSLPKVELSPRCRGEARETAAA